MPEEALVLIMWGNPLSNQQSVAQLLCVNRFIQRFGDKDHVKMSDLSRQGSLLTKHC
jgi:hypothetical protein